MKASLAIARKESYSLRGVSSGVFQQPASVPSPNCRSVCRKLVRQFGDKGTLAELKCSCGLCLANAFESPLQIRKAFARHHTRAFLRRPSQRFKLRHNCCASTLDARSFTEPRMQALLGHIY